jgi:hypothetical protein
MASEKEKRKRKLAQAADMAEANTAMQAAAPTKGSKGSYLKLPEGVDYFQPKQGVEYKLIFLPWIAGKGNHAKEGKGTANRFMYVHKDVGPNSESYLCPAKAKGKPCPVCQQFAKMQPTAKTKDDWDAIKDLRPKARELFLVLNVEEPSKILVWEESCFLFGDNLRALIARKPTKYGKWANIEDGLMVEVMGKELKVGTGTCTKFENPLLSDREGAIPEKILDKLETLCPDDWVVEVSYDKLKKLLSAEEDTEEERDPPAGTEEEDDSDEDDSELEPESDNASLKTPAKKPAPKPEPEDEEEDEEPEEPSDLEDEEEDEEPEPPKKKPKK